MYVSPTIQSLAADELELAKPGWIVCIAVAVAVAVPPAVAVAGAGAYAWCVSVE